MIKSLQNELGAAISVAPAARTDGTVNGTGRAYGDCKSAGLIVISGTITDGTHTVEMQDSDDNSSFTAVDDSLIDGTEPALAGTDDNTVTVLGYLGTKKYLRAVLTVASSTTGGTVGVLVGRIDPYKRPLA